MRESYGGEPLVEGVDGAPLVPEFCSRTFQVMFVCSDNVLRGIPSSVIGFLGGILSIVIGFGLITQLVLTMVPIRGRCVC